jgi:hypothetical protein
VQATNLARLLATAVLSPTGPFERTVYGKWDPAGAGTTQATPLELARREL